MADVVMYDSVTVGAIPANAFAVAGYVNGRYLTWPVLPKTHPHSRRLSIAVSADHDADCLDVERGDATPDEAPAWVKRQLKRGVVRPVVYTSVSNAPALLATLKRRGVERSQVRLWTAHYSYRPHRCTPLCRFGMWTRADATQWTDHSLGRNLDESRCAPDFFGVPPNPRPPKIVLRHRLRWWLQRQRKRGVSWAALKRTANWKLWRRLGGR